MGALVVAVAGDGPGERGRQEGSAVRGLGRRPHLDVGLRRRGAGAVAEPSGRRRARGQRAPVAAQDGDGRPPVRGVGVGVGLGQRLLRVDRRQRVAAAGGAGLRDAQRGRVRAALQLLALDVQPADVDDERRRGQQDGHDEDRRERAHRAALVPAKPGKPHPAPCRSRRWPQSLPWARRSRVGSADATRPADGMTWVKPRSRSSYVRAPGCPPGPQRPVKPDRSARPARRGSPNSAPAPT